MLDNLLGGIRIFRRARGGVWSRYRVTLLADYGEYAVWERGAPPAVLPDYLTVLAVERY